MATEDTVDMSVSSLGFGGFRNLNGVYILQVKTAVFLDAVFFYQDSEFLHLSCIPGESFETALGAHAV